MNESSQRIRKIPGIFMQNFHRWRTLLIVVLVYVVSSSIWILYSDRLVLELYGQDVYSTTRAQTIKGLVFVAMSATMIFIVLGMELRRRFREETIHRAETSHYIKALKSKTEEVEEAYEAIIKGWALALEFRDLETAGHSRRVTAMMEFMGKLYNFSEHELRLARYGAILHDVGKMGVPDAILLKPGALTQDERAQIELHTKYAESMIKRTPYLEQALDIPLYHHERWNGSGYPSGLCEKDIPLAARIFAVIDVADALSSTRIYHAAMQVDEVYHYLTGNSGALFDPEVVALFVEHDVLRLEDW